MSEVSKSLIVSFDALNLVKGIKSIGGPDKQVFYIESNLFAPDRRITPLILQPYILVEDPHNIIPSGDKVSELSSAEWYFDEIKSENRITAKEENASIDTPFALGANNSLHIRKNVEKAIQLFFEAEYLDTRKNKNIHISLTYLLSTTSSSEVKPAPKLKLSKPQSWKYCPLDKVTEATIEAEVFADNKGYKSAVEWCKVEGDKVTPLTNEPFVLGGQNTDKLKINPHVMGDSLIRVRNVSEEFYNKAYGINPEWDNRMQEVMENRNLIINTESPNMWENGFWASEASSSTTLNIRSKFRQDIEHLRGKRVTLSFNSDEYKFGLSFYDKNDVYMRNDTLSKQDSPKVYDIGSDVKYVRFNATKSPQVNISPNEIVDVKPKLEQGDKATPYTPAPEDLNFRNLIANGDFRDGNKNWIFSQSKANFSKVGFCEITSNGSNNYPYFQQIITPNSDLCYTSFFYSPPIQGNMGLSIINQTNNTNTDSITIKTEKEGHQSVISKLNNGFIRFNQSYQTAEIATTNPFSIGNIIVVNLTQTFGKGNEPSKEQLDAVFADMPYIQAPKDYAPDGIILGSYQSDIKLTKYFPEINAEILFLTGDSIRPENKTVKAQALFTTNKEPINNPSEFFDIEWFIDPIEAGGEVKKIGTGEFMEIPITDLQLKGGRLVPIRLKYNFK